MYFTKTITADNGATVSHHRITRIEISPDFFMVRLWGSSWVSGEAYAAGLGSVWPWFVQSQIAENDFDVGLQVRLAEIVTDTDWFTGATVTNEP